MTLSMPWSASLFTLVIKMQIQFSAGYHTVHLHRQIHNISSYTSVSIVFVT